MNQKELDSMTAADLLGLWSARREGAYEDPMPEGFSIGSYGSQSLGPAIDDEAHIASWVEGVEEVQTYRRALVVVLEGGLMPHQAMERQTLLRQTSRVHLRTWRRWARDWNLDHGTSLAVGRFALNKALEGIERKKKWGMGPKMPERHPVLCREEEIMSELPDVVAKAEERFPSRFAQKGDGYLTASRDERDGTYCGPKRNYWNIRGHRLAS